MTNQETIEELKYDCNELGKSIPCDTGWGVAINSAYDMAIKALEKQIPKKILEPKPFQNNDSPIHFNDCVGKCPSCGHVLYKGVGLHKGCPYCLQAIDWSES